MCDRMWQMGGGGKKNREKCGRRLWTAPKTPAFHRLFRFDHDSVKIFDD